MLATAMIMLLILYIAQLPYIMLREYKRSAYMTAWLIIVFLCPFFGMVFYSVWGKRFGSDPGMYRIKREGLILAHSRSTGIEHQEEVSKGLLDQKKLYKLLTGLEDCPITSRNSSAVLTDGRDTYAAILEAIETAKQHIHLDYYTIRDDQTGMRFQKALMKKAKQGVEVRVVYDGIGSHQLGKDFINKLQAAGVQCACFSPARLAMLARRLNFRNHRKIVVIDGFIGFVGGINIGDEYVGGDAKLGFWRDTHLRLEGDSVYFLQELFIQDWELAARERLDADLYMPPHSCKGRELIQVVPSMPGRHEQLIKEMLFAALGAATTRIYLTTPYFIPEAPLTAALQAAAKGGIDVRIIIPDTADSRLVMLASLSYIEEMLDAGVRIYRYEKGFIHAKVLIIDHMLATVGTANFDMRSLNSNLEVNAVLFEQAAIVRLEQDFRRDLHHCRELGAKSFRERSQRQKLAETFMHMLSPLL